MSSSSSEITDILQEWSTGEPKALEALLPLVMNDLRRAAAFYFQREDPDHTLQPTALVSEVCLRLMGRRKVQWDSRAQFFSFAGKLMRYILIEHARSRKAAIRGGGLVMESLTAALEDPLRPPVDLDTILDLHRALSRLEEDDPRAAKVVELRYFAGMTEQETAKVLDIAVSTVKRDWDSAKRRLARELDGGSDPASFSQ
jgi:RNA polymerase sigma-70 factor, ECF subfamily